MVRRRRAGYESNPDILALVRHWIDDMGAFPTRNVPYRCTDLQNFPVLGIRKVLIQPSEIPSFYHVNQ